MGVRGGGKGGGRALVRGPFTLNYKEQTIECGFKKHYSNYKEQDT